jgi:hypothetical protein
MSNTDGMACHHRYRRPVNNGYEVCTRCGHTRPITWEPPINQPEPKQYAQRDIIALDQTGNYYSVHVQAMTAEGLFSKSDIAAELAWRDQRIADLERYYNP